VVGCDDALIFNDCHTRRLPEEMERETREVAAHLGHATQRAIAAKFRTS
jgi:hypothetical protein